MPIAGDLMIEDAGEPAYFLDNPVKFLKQAEVGRDSRQGWG
jgi:hypothetical protein